jgi:hypothetical protein
VIDAERVQFGRLLTATFEVYGSAVSDTAISIWWSALSAYSLAQVRAGLSAHIKNPERGRFSPKPADVIGEIGFDDDRPGPEEAWSALPKNEADSVFWTDEMRAASAVAQPMITAGDLIAARMAFLESYRSLVKAARNTGAPTARSFSPGSDKSGREAVILDAVEKGWLTAEGAQAILPHHREDESLDSRLLALASNAVRRIGTPTAD